MQAQDDDDIDEMYNEDLKELFREIDYTIQLRKHATEEATKKRTYAVSCCMICGLTPVAISFFVIGVVYEHIELIVLDLRFLYVLHTCVMYTFCLT